MTCFEILGITCTAETMPNAAVLGKDFIVKYRAQGGTGHFSPNMYGVCYIDNTDGKGKVPYGRVLVRHAKL